MRQVTHKQAWNKEDRPTMSKNTLWEVSWTSASAECEPSLSLVFFSGQACLYSFSYCYWRGWAARRKGRGQLSCSWCRHNCKWDSHAEAEKGCRATNTVFTTDIAALTETQKRFLTYNVIWWVLDITHPFLILLLAYFRHSIKTHAYVF